LIEIQSNPPFILDSIPRKQAIYRRSL